MRHLSKEEFFKAFDVNNMKLRNRKLYQRIYNRVLKEWNTPQEWLESDIKTIRLESRTTDYYWIAWSFISKEKLDVNFIKNIKFQYSEKILKIFLSDFDELLKGFERLKKEYTAKYLKKIFTLILKLCLYKGIDSMEEITVEDIVMASKNKVLKHDGDRTVLRNLLVYMGYIEEPEYADLHEKIKEQKQTINKNWSSFMQESINNFIEDLLDSKINSEKSVKGKINGLNLFSKWFAGYKDINQIKNLLDFNREEWIKYIQYIREIDNITDKTKMDKLLSLVQFMEWLQIKNPQIMSKEKFYDRGDYLCLSNNSKSGNLAFEKREYGERILSYLINEFRPKNIREIFKKEAIIIAANSGMRISEIRRIIYDSCFYSEDEGLYKIILDYSDKLNQENRPVYLTKDGYEAVKRLEKIRREKGYLYKKYNDRTSSKFIHLFDYRGTDPINKTSLEEFFKKIKIHLGLLDDENKPIKGAMHAWRHFFAMTIFRESNYNIGVVRYFLGHRKYDMSFQYLEEEKERLCQKVRNEVSKIDNNFSGKGLDTLMDILMRNNNKESKTLNTILKSSKNLADLIEFGDIKKVSFGYCIKLCENANRCISCKNFFIAQKDKQEIIKSAKELFEIICFKISTYKTIEDALNNTSIQNDIADMQILIEEMNNLDINVSEVLNDLENGGDYGIKIS